MEKWYNEQEVSDHSLDLYAKYKVLEDLYDKERQKNFNFKKSFKIGCEVELKRQEFWKSALSNYKGESGTVFFDRNRLIIYQKKEVDNV